MAASLADLLAAVSKDDVLRAQLSLLASQNLPVTAWQPGGVARALVEVDAEILADLTRSIHLLATAGFLGTAQGPWLDLKGESDYDEPRKPASLAVGKIRLQDAAGVGPVTVNAGQLIAVSAGGLEYANTAGGTLPLNGTLDLAFAARGPGAAYNVPNNTITRLGTDLPGVAISNVPQGSTGTWLTTSGTDAESDEQYRDRCRRKWAALGTGANADAYRYFALEADATLRKVQVAENSPGGGQVTVYVASQAGPPTAAALAAATAAIELRRPLGVRAYVNAASAYAVNVTGTVNARAALLERAKAAVAANLLAYQARLGIGDPVYAPQVVEEIMSAEGVVNCSLAAPTVDVFVPAGSVAAFVNGLTFYGV